MADDAQSNPVHKYRQIIVRYLDAVTDDDNGTMKWNQQLGVQEWSLLQRVINCVNECSSRYFNLIF